MPYLLFILCCLFPIWIAVRAKRKTQNAAIVMRKKRNSQGEVAQMLKWLETLIGKRCIVHTIDHNYEGVVERIEDGYIVLKERFYDSLAFINPEYVIGVVVVERKEKRKKKEKETMEESELSESAQNA